MTAFAADTRGRRIQLRALSPWAIAVGALTLIGLLLRVAAIRQSLYGDELFAFRETGSGLGDLFHALGPDGEEVSPPLYFLLAWGTRRLGDATVWIRLPSLLAGTATVPVVYALGSRTLGRRAGLAGAAFVALSPFAIFYSTEARPYATMAFLVALSSLALIRALDGRGVAWWAVYAASACGALYTHYTSVYVVAAQAGWAFWVHRKQLRPLVFAHLAILACFLPWLPSLVEQSHKKDYIAILGLGEHLSPRVVFDFQLRVVSGHTFRELDAIPGGPGLVLLALAGLIGLVGVAVGLSRGRGPWQPVNRSTFWLIVILAVATPVGLLAYGLVGSSLFNVKNLSASAPALTLLIAAILTSLRPVLAVTAVGLVIAALALGTTKSFEQANERPAFRQVADFIDSRAEPGDAVVHQLFYGWQDPALQANPGSYGPFNALALYLEGPHPLVDAGHQDPSAAWERAAHGARVFYVRPQTGFTVGLPPLAGPDHQVVLREGRFYGGLLKLAVGEYSGAATARLASRGGRQVISWWGGKEVAVVQDAARGAVETVAPGGASIRGWATDAAAKSPADWILAFEGDRFLGAARPNGLRPDLAKAYGRGALLAGFTVTPVASGGPRPSRRAQVRAFALVGRRASELGQVR